MTRTDWVKPYHDKVTESWINHVYPVNKGNMKRVDNQWARGFKVRSKGMIHVSVYDSRLVIPIEPRNIATKIKNALPASEQKAPPTVTVLRNTAKRKRSVPEPEGPGPLFHQCSDARESVRYQGVPTVKRDGGPGPR